MCGIYTIGSVSRRTRQSWKNWLDRDLCRRWKNMLLTIIYGCNCTLWQTLHFWYVDELVNTRILESHLYTFYTCVNFYFDICLLYFTWFIFKITLWVLLLASKKNYLNVVISLLAYVYAISSFYFQRCVMCRFSLIWHCHTLIDMKQVKSIISLISGAQSRNNIIVLQSNDILLVYQVHNTYITTNVDA